MLLLFAGFLIPPVDMTPVFGWLHHINPMYYGYENVSPPAVQAVRDIAYESLAPRQ